MEIVVTLSPKWEAVLCERAVRQGQDVSVVTSDLIASVLAWEEQDSEAAIQEIQQGLDDFESGSISVF